MGTSGQMSTSNTYVKYTITINQDSQSISGNHSNITVSVRFFRTNSGYETYGTGTVYCKINGTTYSASVSPSQRITNSGIVLFSKNLNIYHNDDGSKYLDTSAWISLNTPLSSSEQWYGQWLSTIPRASSVSGGSGNIGGTSSVSISRASSGFTHILYYSFGSISWRWIASNVGTSYTWTLPNDLYAQIPNANSGTGTLICETYNNGTYIGNSSIGFTAKVVNSNPTFSTSNVSYQDTNSSVVAITGNNQHIVRNQSNLSASFTSATAKNSASMSKYEITFNGATQTKTAASTINYGAVNSGNDLTLTVKAIDSRGNSTSVSKTVTIFDWQLPTAIITANRENNYEDQTFLKAETTISSVNSKNALQELKYRYKRTSDSTYSDYIAIENSTQYTININKIYAWDFQFVVADKFGSTTYNLTIAKGTPIMFFDNEKLSVGVNCFPAKNESFEINGRTIFDMVYPVGSIYMSINSVNPGTIFGGTWARFGNGKHPIGVDENDSSFNTPNKTGGDKTHRHEFRIGMHFWYGTAVGENNGSGTGAYYDGESRYDGWTRSLASVTTNINTGLSTGANSSTPNGKYSVGRTATNNYLAPYITVYMWRRTA